MRDVADIAAVIVAGGLAIGGFIGLVGLAVLIPAFVVTWAWNFWMPSIWTAAPALVWWQTLLCLTALGIITRRLKG